MVQKYWTNPDKHHLSTSCINNLPTKNKNDPILFDPAKRGGQSPAFKPGLDPLLFYGRRYFYRRLWDLCSFQQIDPPKKRRVSASSRSDPIRTNKTTKQLIGSRPCELPSFSCCFFSAKKINPNKIKHPDPTGQWILIFRGHGWGGVDGGGDGRNAFDRASDALQVGRHGGHEVAGPGDAWIGEANQSFG